MNKPEKQPDKLKLELPEGLEAIYANLVRISHSPAELVFDFASLLPGRPESEIIARILMSPVGAKMFYKALGSNLARYEASFGAITLPGGGASLAQNLFRHIQPPDQSDSEEPESNP